MTDCYVIAHCEPTPGFRVQNMTPHATPVKSPIEWRFKRLILTPQPAAWFPHNNLVEEKKRAEATKSGQ